VHDRIVAMASLETQRTTATTALVTSAVIWGFAFVAQRAGMRYIGPFTFNGIRFALGSLILVPLYVGFRRHGVPLDAPARKLHVWTAMGLAGVVLFVSANLQQTGLVYTTAGKAGFITGLYVVIVPLLGLFRRHRVGVFVWIGCAFAVIGLYLLSVMGAFSIALGDALVLGSALGWAIHVHIVGWLAQRARTLFVAILQFGICALLSFGVAIVREPILLASILEAGWMIAYAGILSVGVAYTLQVIGQRNVDPARASIILSSEAVFAVLGGWIVLGETLSSRGLIGCALMLGGMILAQIRPREPRQGSHGLGS